MLEDIKVGDRVINTQGEEATVTKIKVFDNGRTRLSFDSPITGWINDLSGKSWSYESDGKFVKDPGDRRANDLVKVVKHD